MGWQIVTQDLWYQIVSFIIQMYSVVKTFKCKRCFIISTYAATLHWKMHSSRFLVWIAFWAAPDSEHPAKEASAQLQSLLPMLQLAWDIFRYMISFANKTKYKVQQFWHPNIHLYVIPVWVVEQEERHTARVRQELIPCPQSPDWLKRYAWGNTWYLSIFVTRKHLGSMFVHTKCSTFPPKCTILFSQTNISGNSGDFGVFLCSAYNGKKKTTSNNFSFFDSYQG